jgi:hypothetical protein
MRRRDFVTVLTGVRMAVYSARTVLQDKGDDVCILECGA